MSKFKYIFYPNPKHYKKSREIPFTFGLVLETDWNDDKTPFDECLFRVKYLDQFDCKVVECEMIGAKIKLCPITNEKWDKINANLDKIKAIQDSLGLESVR